MVLRGVGGGAFGDLDAGATGSFVMRMLVGGSVWQGLFYYCGGTRGSLDAVA